MRLMIGLACVLSLLGCSDSPRVTSPVAMVVPGNGLGTDPGGPGLEVPLALVPPPLTGYTKTELPQQANVAQGAAAACYSGSLNVNGETLVKHPRYDCTWYSGGYSPNGVESSDGQLHWTLNCNSNGGKSRLVYGYAPGGIRADYTATGVNGPGTYYLEGYTGVAKWPATVTVN